MIGPLAGVHVVELGGIGPVPFAGMTLAGMGADVLRIARPGGDPFFGGREDADLLNRGKRLEVIDLKGGVGRERCLDLLRRADIVLEGHRPGVAERLGLGPADVAAGNVRVVYGRMTGWGQDGPRRQQAGHDINYISLTGALDAIGISAEPVIPLNVVGDFGGGSMYLVAGVLAALHQAQVTGRGDVVDAAIVDGTAHLLSGVHAWMASDRWRPSRGRNLVDGGAPSYAVYRTSDDLHVAVGALEPPFFEALKAGLGLDWEGDHLDPSRWDELRPLIAARFATRTRDDWVAVFAGTDACVTPVLSLNEAVDDEHMAARGALFRRDGRVEAGPAPRFLRAGNAELTRPPVPPG